MVAVSPLNYVTYKTTRIALFIFTQRKTKSLLVYSNKFFVYYKTYVRHVLVTINGSTQLYFIYGQKYYIDVYGCGIGDAITITI